MSAIERGPASQRKESVTTDSFLEPQFASSQLPSVAVNNQPFNACDEMDDRSFAVTVRTTEAATRIAVLRLQSVVSGDAKSVMLTRK